MSDRPGYVATAAAFDQVAPGYDEAYGPGGSALMGRMRRESLGLLMTTFPHGSRLLEIGCGTGEEAVALARLGYRVLATDLSPRMATLTAAKARQAGVAERVTVLAIPAGDLGALQIQDPFDGAYASFGSLNCEPALQRVVEALAGHIRPGGAFVCTVMARWCPVEVAWQLAHLRPREAFRRSRRGWQLAGIHGVGGKRVEVPVSYYSAVELARTFEPQFKLERVMAFLLLLPPPYLEGFYHKYRPLFERLEVWERRLREKQPWNGLGDHLALTFRKAG